MSRNASFESPFADMMERFVVHKRMQGFDYTSQENRLKLFDRFLGHIDCSDGLLHREYFIDYLKTLSHLSLKTKDGRLGVTYQFSLFLNAFRPESHLVPRRLLPAFTRNTRFCRIPPEQVYELMCAANELRPKGGIRAGCIRFLIGLLYTTGLRISEAINLNLGQVDLERGTLFIRRGKFGKDRLIALEPSTKEALEEWLDLRSAYASNGPSAPLLVSALNKPLNRHQAERAFRRLCEQCGFQNNPRARLHDLRHNFACQCLAQWQREGKDIHTLLPVLSTAMGHVNPCATQRYIHIDAATLLDASDKIHDRFTQSPEKNQ